MKNWKSLLIAVAVLPVAVSCLNDGKHHNKFSFTVEHTFEHEAFSVSATDSIGLYPRVYAESGYTVFDATVQEDPGALLGGFALSRRVDPVTGADYEGKSPLHCISKPLLPEEKTFLVFYQSDDMPEKQIWFDMPNSDCLAMPLAMYFNNTQAFVNAVRTGRGLSGGPFAENDWAEVRLTGYLRGAKTGEASLRLADFENFRDSVVTTWTPLDGLGEKLGNVDQISISLASSREDMVPYVCLDHLIFKLNIEY